MSARGLAAASDALYERIAAILDDARSRVARTVNTAMVSAYWLIGREIVEVEQGGKARAAHGDRLIEVVARKISKRFGKGLACPPRDAMRRHRHDGRAPALTTASSGVRLRLGAVVHGRGRRRARPARAGRRARNARHALTCSLEAPACRSRAPARKACAQRMCADSPGSGHGTEAARVSEPVAVHGAPKLLDGASTRARSLGARVERRNET